MRRAVMMLLVAMASCSGPAEDCPQVGTDARAFSETTLKEYASGCSTAADCVLTRPMLSCYTGCFSAVLKSREANAQSAVLSLTESVCGRGTCSVNEGCNPVHAECVQGVCKAMPGGATADAGSRDGG